MLAGEAIEVSDSGFVDSYSGKEKKPYVAVIRGEGQQFALDRSFVKGGITKDGAVLPDRNGIFEVRDYPDGSKRTRYYQVMDGAVLLLTPLNDDEVLDAVASSDANEWASCTAARGEGEAEVAARATPLEVYEVIERVEQDMLEAFRSGDEEDVSMLLDRIKVAVERL